RTFPGSALLAPGTAQAIVASPGAPNLLVEELPAFDPLWLNELQSDNAAGLVDNFGEREPWIELYNAGPDPLSLDGHYLAGNYAPPVPVFINEWMAANTIAVADPADGGFEDWFELYNAGTNWVDLGGYYLSDTPANPLKYRIPSGYTLSPGGFLLVWADEETSQNQTDRPDLHVN